MGPAVATILQMRLNCMSDTAAKACCISAHASLHCMLPPPASSSPRSVLFRSERPIAGTRAARSAAVGGLTARKPSKASFQSWLSNHRAQMPETFARAATRHRLAGRLALLGEALGTQLAVRQRQDKQCIVLTQQARICTSQ